MNKLRILHVAGGLANSSGTTHIIYGLSTCMVRSGYAVDIFYVSGRTPDTLMPFSEGINVRGFPLTFSRSWAYSYELATALCSELDHYDIIHVHSLWYYPVYAVRQACQRAGRPYLISPQGALDPWALKHHSLRKKIYAVLMERRLLNAAAAIHAVSDTEAESIRSFGVRAPVFTVPNGINPADWSEIPEKKICREVFQLPERSPVILFLGRINPKKRPDILLGALRKILDAVPAACLVIAGEDGGSGYKLKLETMVTSMGLSKHVRFIGEVSGAKKRYAFGCADLFALPSMSEGLPIAALEAMACGLPLIISPRCGISARDLDGAGLIRQPVEREFVEGISELLCDPGKRLEMGRRAREKACTKFSWEKLSAVMLDNYGRIIARP